MNGNKTPYLRRAEARRAETPPAGGLVLTVVHYSCNKRFIFRPPVRSNGRTNKMLVMFYFSFFSPTVLRVPSTDRPETLPHGRNLRVFFNASPKIRGHSPPKIKGQKHAKFRSILYNLRL